MAELPLTIQDAAKALRAGTVSSVELTATMIARPAQRVRSYAVKTFLELLRPYDALVIPTHGQPALPLEGLTFVSRSQGTTRQATAFTNGWNFLGFPAIAIPMGFSSEGLPLSLQIIGKPFQDGMVLRIADAFQQMTDWHRRVAPIAQPVTA